MNGLDEEYVQNTTKNEIFDVNTKHLKYTFIRVLVVVVYSFKQPNKQTYLMRAKKKRAD